MVRDVDDTAEVLLDVDEWDDTTTVFCTATSPRGQQTTLDPSAIDDGTWAAYLEITCAGEWLVRWQVTGTGEGTERQSVLVRPDPGTEWPAPSLLPPVLYPS